MKFQDLGIRARITIGLLVILLLATLSVGISLYQNGKVKYQAEDVKTGWIPALDNLGHMKGHLADHYLAISERFDEEASTEGTGLQKGGRHSDQARHGHQGLCRHLAHLHRGN